MQDVPVVADEFLAAFVAIDLIVNNPRNPIKEHKFDKKLYQPVLDAIEAYNEIR